MTEAALDHLLQQVIEIAGHTGAFLMAQHGKVAAEAVEVKSLNSLVSYVDKTAEIQLVEGLRQILPEAVFLTEEATIATQSGEYQWVIDPLDGTTNFLHGLPIFSISIALRHRGNAILGVVYDPNRKECFSARLGGGAHLNGHHIRVGQAAALSDCLLATGFPYYIFGKQAAYLQALGYFMENTRGIRRLGSAAIDLAYVAAGRFDGFFESGLNAWDVAAGLLIIEEAGGHTSDFRGNPVATEGGEIIVGNPAIHAAIQKVVGEAFYP